MPYMQAIVQGTRDNCFKEQQNKAQLQYSTAAAPGQQLIVSGASNNGLYGILVRFFLSQWLYLFHE